MSESSSMRRLALASITGTALEYYDFAVYNTLAALVFNQLFFAPFDALSGTMLAYVTFAVGYVSRLPGGILFGYLGDRYGRRFVLVVTLMVMGTATVLIGLLPTYAQIGALAPILLVTLRFLQGMALGGEWAGAVLLTVEHGDNSRRGRNASYAQMGPPIGVLLATGVIALTTWLIEPQELLAWGWRLPLLVSVVLVAFGLWLRVGVSETPQFRAAQRSGTQSRAPVGEVVRSHWRGLLVAGGSRIGPDVMFSLVAIFSLTYITTVLGLSRTLATAAVSLGAGLNALMIFYSGRL
ncbi:MAG TPA: MFS transporter, partial [Steroidobacteraceae bacterium]|nr:MFS transporter [Steroidobacteraceae bacterium]